MNNQSRPKINKKQAVELIKQRVNGMYDSPELMAWGPLGTTDEDIQEMGERGRLSQKEIMKARNNN